MALAAHRTVVATRTGLLFIVTAFACGGRASAPAADSERVRAPVAASEPSEPEVAPTDEPSTIERPAPTPGSLRVRWALTAGGVECDAAEDVAVDGAGNAIVVGQFQDLLELGEASLRSAGGTDVFVASVDRDGQLLWARRFGGAGNDLAISVAVSSAGDALVLGSLAGAVTIDGRAVGGSHPEAGFLLALDADGATRWVRSFGASIWDLPWDVAVDARDRPLVAGAFRGELQIGGRRIGSVGEADAYVARFDGDGGLDWAMSLASDGWTHAAALAPLDGDVLVAGTFSGRADLGPDVLESAGAGDVFVARLGGGQVRWARRYGGPGVDRARALVVNPDRSMVLGGSFTGRTDLGAGLEAAGDSDGFVAGLSDDGVVSWVRRIGGEDADDVRALAAARSGRLWVAIRFAGSLQTGDREVAARRATDLLLVALGPGGAPSGSWQIAGGGPMMASRGIASDGDAIVVAGAFAGAADFGAEPAESEGICDLFLFRFVPVGNERSSR